MTDFRVRPGLTIRELPDGDAVVAGSTDADAVIINSSAHAILELLDEPRSEADIASVFRDAFPDQDESKILHDVHVLVEELVRAGIVETCGSASSTA